VSAFVTLSPQTIPFEGLNMRVWRGGSGFPLLLLHGSGPGASAIGNWRTVLELLSSHYEILAPDLIGFGESDRKSQPPYFDLGLWQRQIQFIAETFLPGPLGVVGHSLSASLALHMTAQTPRVTAVLATGAMGAPTQDNDYLQMVWRCPKSRDEMRRAALTLIKDPKWVTDAYLNARMQIIGTLEYQTYFDSMFEGARQTYLDAAVVPAQLLSSITQKTLFLHGRDDLAFPVDVSRALAAALPNADLWELSECRHSVALERPDAFHAAIEFLFGAQTKEISS
jgi:2-hydroxymuconate-semialdehyde hydrolase